MNRIVREARVSPLVFTFLTFIAIVAILYTHDVSWASFQKQSAQNLPAHHETAASPERFDLTAVDLKHKNSEDTRETRLPFAVGRTPEDCDIFSGRWVRDNKGKPLYEESECPYLMPQVTCQEHGHPTKVYQHWRWQPYGCDLPTFNATLMLEALRGKRMLYVGDSLNRGQYVSMVCLLQKMVPESGKSMKSSYDSLTVFRLKDYNATIEFYWAPLLLESNGDGFGNNNVSERIIRKGSIDKHGKFWEGADIVVFNTYIWWMTNLKLKILKGSFTDEVQEFENLNPEEAYRMGMQSMLDWIQRNMDPKKTRVFFRGMSPSHTRSIRWGGDADGNCYNETTPIDDPKYNWASHSHENIMRIVGEEFRKTRVPISFLNITQLSTYRKDAHTQIYKKQWGPLTPEQLANPKSYADCVHWCLPGLQDTWNELLYAKLFYP